MALTASVILLWPVAWMQVLLILLAGMAGLVLHADKACPPSTARNDVSQRRSLSWLALFALLLMGLPLLARLTGWVPLQWFDAFYRTGSLVFGGGHVVLPLLESAVVRSGWVNADTFLAGYGLAQAVVGLLLAALYQPVWRNAILTPQDAALGLLAFIALMFWKLPPWLVVILCGLGGWGMRGLM